MSEYLSVGTELIEAMSDLHRWYVSPSGEQRIRSARNRSYEPCSPKTIQRFQVAAAAIGHGEPAGPLKNVSINGVSAASAWRLMVKIKERTSGLLQRAQGSPSEFDEELRKLLLPGPGWKPDAFAELQSELECQLQATPVFVQEDFMCDGRLLTQKVVEAVYGHSKSSLSNWRTKGCPKLGGRLIITSSAYGSGLVYLHGDLLLIERKSCLR